MTLREYFLENKELADQWHRERNPLSPAGLGLHSRQKVWWRCARGHAWQASPQVRVVQGHGCPYCAAQLVCSGETDLATRYPHRAKLWHPEKNGTLTPAQVAPGSRAKAWWLCEKGHAWQARISSVVLTECGCPYCSGLKPLPGETDLATRLPEIAAQWDMEKNAPLTPSEVTPGSKNKVWWRCARGHSWQTTVFSVALDGCGCPYCAGRKAIPGQTDLVTLHPEVARQWDGDKNGELDPGTVTPASHEKVWWLCEKGHSWQAAPYTRTKEKGAGCPYCTGRKVLPGFNDLATRKPGLAEEWYAPLNGGLSPRDVTLGSNKKVWWRCREHHVWQACVYARTRKNGTDCPVCAGVAKARRIRYFEDAPKASPGNRGSKNGTRQQACPQERSAESSEPKEVRADFHA